MVYFLGLPPALRLFGGELPTYIPLMGLFLCITLFMTLTGGFLTVMITDCIEGMLSQVFYLVIIAALLWMFSWPQINSVLVDRPPGQSLVNPFDSLGLKDFNLWYVLMGAFLVIYGTGAWQHSSAYKSAAITPHASVMANILGRWRENGKGAVVTLLAVCAVTFLKHPDFAAQAMAAHAETAAITNIQIRSQMEVPIALAHFLPMGVKGLLCAILVMGIVGGDSTHLHSWGGIFVQDVLVPLRKQPFGPLQHIRALRLSIVGVAVFAFLFGTFFQQTEYIFMWWSVTTAIYVGGAGACIVGGLYWKKGTTAGAWAALVSGSTLSAGGILMRQVYGSAFPMNGIQVSMTATLIAITVYMVVSLLTSRQDFDLDRMLYRGKYAEIRAMLGEVAEPLCLTGWKVRWGKLIGIDGNFSQGDKWIAGALFSWNVFLFTVFLIGTTWNVIAPWPTAVWSSYWHVVGIGIPILISCVTGVWFTWGGVRDIRDLFQRLRIQKINNLDDGTVIGHRNQDENAV